MRNNEKKLNKVLLAILLFIFIGVAVVAGLIYVSKSGEGILGKMKDFIIGKEQINISEMSVQEIESEIKNLDVYSDLGTLQQSIDALSYEYKKYGEIEKAVYVAYFSYLEEILKDNNDDVNIKNAYTKELQNFEKEVSQKEFLLTVNSDVSVSVKPVTDEGNATEEPIAESDEPTHDEKTLIKLKVASNTDVEIKSLTIYSPSFYNGYNPETIAILFDGGLTEINVIKEPGFATYVFKEPLKLKDNIEVKLKMIYTDDESLKINLWKIDAGPQTAVDYNL